MSLALHASFFKAESKRLFGNNPPSRAAEFLAAAKQNKFDTEIAGKFRLANFFKNPSVRNKAIDKVYQQWAMKNPTNQTNSTHQVVPRFTG